MVHGKPRSRALAVVYATVFLDLLGFGLILPFLPYYAESLGARGTAIGLLFASYSIAQLLGAVALGRLSDRFGRRPILLAALAGSTASMIVAGFATTLVGLAAARALAGAFGGSISAAQAYVADVTQPEERARFMGFLGAAIGLGFVLGPGLGAGLIALGLHFPGAAFTAAALSATSLAFALAWLPEPDRSAHAGPLRPGWSAVLAALGQRRLSPLLFAGFFTTLAFVSMEATFGLFVKERFGLGERGFGLTLMGVGMVGIVIQGGLIGRLTRRFGVGAVAITGTTLLGLALAALPFCPSLTTLAPVLALMAAGQGLSSPSLSTLLSQRAPTGEQGLVLGTGQSLAAAARAVGPILAGALYDLRHTTAYLTAGAFSLLAAGLVAKRGGDSVKKETPP